MLLQKGLEILGYMENELVGKDWVNTCISTQIEEEILDVFNKVMKEEKKVEELDKYKVTVNDINILLEGYEEFKKNVSVSDITWG